MARNIEKTKNTPANADPAKEKHNGDDKIEKTTMKEADTKKPERFDPGIDNENVRQRR